MSESALFSSTRWDIISLLSQRPYSPLEMAKLTGTSIANISQQLRMLEAYGIVKRERTQASGPGKPRALYSISASKAYVALASKWSSDKGMVKVSLSEEMILRIWMHSDGHLREMMTSWSMMLSKHLSDLHYIGLETGQDVVKIFMVVGTASLGKTRSICVRALSKSKSPVVKFHIVSFLHWRENPDLTVYDIKKMACLHRSEKFSIEKGGYK